MKYHKRLSFLLLISLLALTLQVIPVSASGPGEGGRRVRLDDEPAGPYLLRVVTSPTPPKVENYNVEVRVIDAATGKVLTDVNVLIVAQPAESDGESISELATHDIAPIPNEYAAHLLVHEDGLWNISVEVEGELGRGEVSFVERISSPVSLGWLVAFGPPVVGMAILVFVFIRLQRHSRQSGEGGSEGA